MPFIHVEITDEFDKKLRIAIINRFGAKKGALQQAVTEALELWLKEKEG